MTSQPPVQRRSWQVMGTVASLIAGCDPATADSARDAAAGVLSDVEARMSSYRPDSEVSRFAAGQLPAGPSADLRSVLAACSWLEEVSAGVFSPYPGGPGTELDVAGYVKGWAVDRAAEALDSIGLEHWALSVGGDWRCRGGHPSGDPWRITILDPTDSAQVRAVVLVTDLFRPTRDAAPTSCSSPTVLLPPAAVTNAAIMCTCHREQSGQARGSGPSP